MPARELLSEMEIRDFVRGCTFLGTGGGGNPDRGLSTLLGSFRQGKRIRWVDIRDIDDGAWTTSLFYTGSIAPLSDEKRKTFAALGLTERKVDSVLSTALLELESYLRFSVNVIVPVEIGGENTPVPLDVAAQLDKVVVDGDFNGKSVPEIEHDLPSIMGKEATPFVCVDGWGNVTIIKHAATRAVGERLTKLFSTLTPGLCGQTAYTMKARDLREVLIPGTLTQAYEIDRVIRQARDSGDDPVTAVIDSQKGWLLFTGRVQKKDWEDKDGYMYGMTYIAGVEQFEGHHLKIWFKNENLVSWLDERPFVTSPDLVEVVEARTAEPITNTDLAAGQEVAVIGLRARAQHRTAKGVAAHGPRYFGFDMEYTPIEELLRERE